MYVTQTGSAVWRLKYRIDGNERVFSAGVYPEVPLAEARLARADARELVRDGHDCEPLARPVAKPRTNRRDEDRMIV
ncbi:MAG: Arm DNA-binding domain-containing protein, partial [Gemmatimonas sp.]